MSIRKYNKNSEVEYGKGKVLRGKVISTKMLDTVTVLVEYSKLNKRVNKRILKTKRILAHSTGDVQVNEGDFVFIKESRPLSKNKHFVVAEVASK